MTENLTLNQAIKALNNGKRVTHDFLNDHFLVKNPDYSEDAIHEIKNGWNVIDDPLHKGDTYYLEYLSPTLICDYNGYVVNKAPHFKWKNDDSKRNFPVDGWRIVDV